MQWQKINNRSHLCAVHLHCAQQMTHISQDDRKSIITLCDLGPKIQYLCISYNKDILINVGTFREKCYQSLDVIYPILKGSGFVKRWGRCLLKGDIYSISRLTRYNIKLYENKSGHYCNLGNDWSSYWVPIYTLC